MNKGKIVLERTREELEEKSESLEDVFFKYTEGAIV
jgi:ABC-2 type transport system ATP-binding protein